MQHKRFKNTDLIEKQLLGGLSDLGLRVVALPAACDDGAALQSGGPTVEYEHGFGPQEQELADSAKEAEQMRVPHHLALLVPHRLYELHHPYACICKEIYNCNIRKGGVVR